MTPAGLILAGGRGSRMGGAVPKPLVSLAGRPLILHVIARLERQAAPLILAAPAGAGYDHLRLPLAPDRRPDLPGPLAGIEAGLQALSVMGTAGPDRLFVTPGDTPFLPVDIVERLASTDLDKPVAAFHAGRIQPATAMWPLAVLPDLERWLDEGRPLAIRAFLEAIGHAVAEIPATADAPAGDPFFNINTPDDLSLAETFLRRPPGD